MSGEDTRYLRALGKEGSDDLGLMRLELPTEVGLRHLGGHSNRLLVTKRELRQRPIAADSISEGGNTCRKGEDAQKWLSNEEAKHMLTRFT